MRAFHAGGSPTREITIALPTREADLYRIHQLVWRHVAQASASRGGPPCFLYRIDGPLIRVRSDAFSIGVATSFRPSHPVYVDLAALHGGGNKQPVPTHLLKDWCARQIGSSGFIVRELDVLAQEVRSGFKAAGGHTITVPVARVRAELSIADQPTCDRTWRTGLGRGKRFGLGMLAH